MKFFSKILGFIFLFFLVAIISHASALSNLTQQLDSLKAVRADFVQTVIDGRGQIIQRAQGQMSLQRPGRFRWEVKHPSKQLLIANGQRIWFYDIDLRQVVIQKQQVMGTNTPAALLSASTLDLEKQFIIKRIGQKGNGFQLTPKDKNALFQSIILVFYETGLHEMRLFDKLGQQTEIIFSNFEKNPQLNSQLFNFILPKDQNIEIVKG